MGGRKGYGGFRREHGHMFVCSSIDVRLTEVVVFA